MILGAYWGNTLEQQKSNTPSPFPQMEKKLGPLGACSFISFQIIIYYFDVYFLFFIILGLD
jgi:hypothetical protein